MKKTLITLILMTCVLIRLEAQDQTIYGNISVKNPMGAPYGINIDLDFGGGWAREFSFTHTATETKHMFGFGAYGSASRLLYGYITGGSMTENYASPWMAFMPSGNIGIGTVSPTSKLEVNGTIRAKEVKIEATGWPDYVFDKDYALPALSEVEDHIKEHKHLPDVPSQQEVITHGVNVVEMQAKLLQKIEELTLYVIRQEKEIKELKAQLNK